MNDNKSLLADRVRTSRLLGQNKSLVLHGGGNTSVKITEKDIFGVEEEILYVKGSGWDLETIDAEGFSPVVSKHLKALASLPALSDSMMVNELVTHLKKASAPVPSVEAILHAIIPFRFVDHTHADAVVAITNSVNGESIIREIYGNSVVIVPYIMPGFDLSKLCADILAKEMTPDTIGIVLLNHGIFSFGNTADESYQRMLDLVKVAESYLEKNTSVNIPETPAIHSTELSLELASLRKTIASHAGFPVIMKRYSDSKSMYFCNRKDLTVISQQGPATPDHVIRTKRLPVAGRDIDQYVTEYKKYFEENEPAAKDRKKILDPAPRVVLDPVAGVCTIGKTAKDAMIVGDIYDHTIDIILRGDSLGGYRALSAKDIFDVEYWELEQAKLQKAGKSPAFTGEIALVTGAASGIGKACVESLLKRGACVVGLDRSESILTLFKGNPAFLGAVCDITSKTDLQKALIDCADHFGGLDMLVLNAGIFPAGKPIELLASEDWQRVMDVNLNANLTILRESFPFLKLAPRGGRIVIIGSKNVAAPGPGAAAYSASKAALNQLARIAAMEWGKEGIRVNTVHPNAVFDTGLWSDDILASRAKSYGLSVEAYKKNNILGTEVTSSDVSELAAELCGSLFSKTTGAQIPVDGGNDRVI